MLTVTSKIKIIGAKQMRYMREIIQDIRHGENIDIYITIIVALAIVILDLLGIAKPDVIISAVLLVLGLLAFSTLATRKTLESLGGAIQGIKKPVSAKSILKSRDEYPPFQVMLEKAHTICFVGTSSINIISQWGAFLYQEKIVKQGATVHFLVLDLDSPDTTLSVQTEDVRADIVRALSILKTMSTSQVSGGGKLDVKLSKYAPKFSMILIDPFEKTGKIYVEFIGYGLSPIHRRPHFEVNKTEDGDWYEYFLYQYQQIWDDAIQA
jgi:hypothetical protein